MCGICGFNFDDRGLLKSMMSVIKHRGPDDFGVYIDTKFSLGHRRLSIIDLKTGKQPIHNETQDIWIIFNGEIYNYKELTKELEKQGHRFYTSSDTEAIIHAYEEYGINFVNKLNGCFSLAILDNNKKQLILARDRLGIKPLYYYFDGEKLIFASEIKSILQYPIKRELNYKALYYFLSFRCNPLEETIFKGIKKILPGHYLIYRNHHISLYKYWDLEFKPSYRSEEFYIKKLFNLLLDAVKLRLMAEVPLGVYLSSGIDSGSIVGLISSMTEEPIKTFSVGFGLDENIDELRKAKITAEYFGIEHKEIIVEPDTINLLPKIVWYANEPMSDPTSIPTYLLSEQAKKHVTVVLTGEGADEQFAGYEQYKFMLLYNKYLKFIPFMKRRFLIKLVPKKLLDLFFKYSSMLGDEGLRRFYEFMTTKDNLDRYLKLITLFSEDEKKQLCKKTYNLNSELESYFSNNILSSCLLFDNKITLPANLLMKVDKNTMAHAIEARVPYLDHRVVEFASLIPSKFKIKNGIEKYIERKALIKLMPKEILKREKDRFFVPIHLWFETELMDISKQMLSEENVKKRNIFNYNYIEKIFKNFKKSKLFYSRQLWSLITFELWYKIYIEEQTNSLPKKPLSFFS